MSESVIFPDAVSVAKAVLDAVTGMPAVRSKVPNPRPASFVTVRRIGGPKLNLVADEPLLIVESWADTESDAAELAQKVRAAINASRGTYVDGVSIYKVEEASGPGVLPDPLSQQARYTQTFTMALRGTLGS